MSDLDEEKKRAEIAKLQAETRKLDREATNSVPQARIAYGAEVAKLVGAIILGIGGVAVAVYQTGEADAKVKFSDSLVKTAQGQLAETTQKLKEVEEKRVAAEARLKQANSDVAQLENASALLETKIAELELKRKSLEGSQGRPRLVFVRFRGDLRRESINDYSAFLATKAFDAPGPLRIAGSYGNRVKYFQAADSPVAAKLAEETREFFRQRGCSVEISTELISGVSPTPPQLEVDLAPQCR